MKYGVFVLVDHVWDEYDLERHTNVDTHLAKVGGPYESIEEALARLFWLQEEEKKIALSSAAPSSSQARKRLRDEYCLWKKPYLIRVRDDANDDDPGDIKYGPEVG